MTYQRKIVICGPITIDGHADAASIGEAAQAQVDAVEIPLLDGEEIPKAENLVEFVELAKDRISLKDLDSARAMVVGIQEAAVLAAESEKI